MNLQCLRHSYKSDQHDLSLLIPINDGEPEEIFLSIEYDFLIKFLKRNGQIVINDIAVDQYLLKQLDGVKYTSRYINVPLVQTIAQFVQEKY